MKSIAELTQQPTQRTKLIVRNHREDKIERVVSKCWVGHYGKHKCVHCKESMAVVDKKQECEAGVKKLGKLLALNVTDYKLDELYGSRNDARNFTSLVWWSCKIHGKKNTPTK